MNKLIVWSFMILVVFQTVLAKNQGKGIGVIIGEPTGISFKIWRSPNTAIDGGVAWSLGVNSRFHFHADYLIHNKSLFKSPNAVLYFGPGARLRMGLSDRIGVRGVVGLNVYFTQAPVDFFLEMAPILDLLPGTYLSFNAGFGFRYFF